MSSYETPATEPSVDIFLARQPIFARNLQVYGFELLYRGSAENSFDNTPGDIASARVIANAVLTLGVEKLLGGKIPFINFDATLLLDYAPLLPFPSAVVEILETVEPTEQILLACRDLKKRRYQLALDDCVSPEQLTPWLGTVDIVKIDFLKTSPEVRKNIVALCKSHKLHPLAEKVESREDFDEAFKLGCEYFQGFFFARATVLKGRAISDTQLLLLELLKEVSTEEMDFDRVEQLVQRNVSFVHKLLRFMNSPLFAWGSQIKSVRHALVLLGEEELRKWICLLLVAGIGAEATPHLLVNSLVRARFAELLCTKVRLSPKKSSAFLVGLLSHLDALLHRPMPEVVSELRLDYPLSEALLGQSDWNNRIGMVYELIRAYEKPDWARTTALAQQFNLSVLDLSTAYVKAVEWADEAARS